jgi:hypothetical protein
MSNVCLPSLTGPILAACAIEPLHAETAAAAASILLAPLSVRFATMAWNRGFGNADTRNV